MSFEIRDILHGGIPVDRREAAIVDSPFFQRLRQIRQMGFAEYSYPSATHNRYIHSLGAMQTATLVFESINRQGAFGKAAPRFKAALRLAALLHDIGHGPLSHTTEFAMPQARLLEIPGDIFARNRKATHEDYTLKIILDSSLTHAIEKAGREHGFKPVHIAALLHPEIQTADDFFKETIDGRSVDFRPLLRQLVSSELDADRMDYLRRDSVYSGVSYGQFDFKWIVSQLMHHIDNEKCYLALGHRALYAFEDFLLSRFNMFLMVYFHHKSVIFDEMLAKYFGSADCDYQLPTQIDRYLEYNDAHLYTHLQRSANPWAKRISEKKPFRVLLELHSGIPATRSAVLEQGRLLARIEKDLEDQGIYYLKVTSTSELSKYFGKPGDPIFVQYDNHYSAPSTIPLNQCTDLFHKYGEKRSITRLYVSSEDVKKCQKSGRKEPLRFDLNAELM